MSRPLPPYSPARRGARMLAVVCLALPLAVPVQAGPAPRYLVSAPAPVRAVMTPPSAAPVGGFMAVRGGGHGGHGGHGARQGGWQGGGGRSWHSGGHSGGHHHAPHYRAYPRGYISYGLPAFATVLTVGALTYYVANDIYYRPLNDGRYEVVPNPLQNPAAALERPLVYPQRGQTPEQQATDEYECHRWAASQSGYDPTIELTTGASPRGEAPRQDYQRATGVCLDARGYAVR